jgi:hypothetical protein
MTTTGSGLGAPDRAGETRRQVALAIIVLAVVAAFSSRAIYIDEHIFLTLGRNALENPLFPSDIDFTFFGVPANLESHTHPPVGNYYLALVSAVFPDFNENVYRILFAVFPILAIVAFYRLARRFTRSPFAVSLLFLVSPAFFVMSPTLMMDIPMLAFLLLGLELFLSHREGRTWRLAAASACFVLSAGVGYTVLVPLGCLFLWVLATRPNVRELAAIAAAPAVIAVWQAAMAAHFGHVPISSTVGYFLEQIRSSIGNAATTLSFVGGVTLFPWAAVFLVRGGRQRRLAGAGAGLLAGLTASTVFDWPTPGAAAWYGILAGAGTFVLGAAAFEAVGRRRESENWSVFMAMWIGAVLLFFVAVGDMINARYMLLAMPPLYWLIFGSTTGSGMAPVIALTLALSTGVAVADYRFVNAYRAWVADVVGPAQSAGYRVWSAAESGLRFYLEESGAEVLPADSLRPEGGDMIVRDVFAYGLAEELSIRLVHARTDVLGDRFPIRSFNMAAGAGFHDSRFGRVPYTLSTAPHDSVSLWQLSPLVERLPQPQNRPPVVWSAEGPVLIQESDRLVFPYAAPDGAVLRYEITEGTGEARLVANGIELTRRSDGRVLWRNLRVVPPAYP